MTFLTHTQTWEEGPRGVPASSRHVTANYCSQACCFGFCDCKLRVTQRPEGEGLLRHLCSLLPHYHSGWQTIDFARHCAAVLSCPPSLGDETQDGTCRHMLIGCPFPLPTFCCVVTESVISRIKGPKFQFNWSIVCATISLLR